MTRTPRVDERDFASEAAQMHCGPAAERTCADDGDARTGIAAEDGGRQRNRGDPLEKCATGERQKVNLVLTPMVRGSFVR